MRLFFAIALPDEVRARLARLARELDELTGAPVGWVPDANLHLTLRFLGDAGEREKKLALEAARAVAIAGAPFRITLEGAGSFGGRSPRVVWVGVRHDDGLAMMKTLAQSLDRALVERGFERADHAFAAHATLGRVRAPRGKQRPTRERAASLEKLVSALERYARFEAGTVDVGRFVLFDSVLKGGQSPEYVPVEQFALGAAKEIRAS